MSSKIDNIVSGRFYSIKKLTFTKYLYSTHYFENIYEYYNNVKLFLNGNFLDQTFFSKNILTIFRVLFPFRFIFLGNIRCTRFDQIVFIELKNKCLYYCTYALSPLTLSLCNVRLILAGQYIMYNYAIDILNFNNSIIRQFNILFNVCILVFAHFHK